MSPLARITIPTSSVRICAVLMDQVSVSGQCIDNIELQYLNQAGAPGFRREPPEFDLREGDLASCLKESAWNVRAMMSNRWNLAQMGRLVALVALSILFPR